MKVVKYLIVYPQSQHCQSQVEISGKTITVSENKIYAAYLLLMSPKKPSEVRQACLFNSVTVIDVKNVQKKNKKR